MSDQAQGLRALADQARRDQNSPSHHPTRVPADTPDHSPPLSTTAAPLGVATVEKAGFALANARLHGDLSGRPLPAALPAAARVVAVTSGKGGVGKTNFSTNLSLTLAQSGQRLIVLDADLGLANLHVLLGAMPRYHLEHVMRGEKSLSEVLHTGQCGVKIIAGGSGITELANLDETMRQTFIAGLRELDTLADVILIDTGAGLARNVLAFLCAVDEVIVLTTPEPTAITDAYATIKVVSQENPTARLMLVVNMAQSEVEAEAVSNRLIMIARQFLHRDLDYLGFIPQDIAVGQAVRMQSPFVLSHPTCAAARGVARIAEQLGYRRVEVAASGGVSGLLHRMQRFFGFTKPTANTTLS
jgi:flagellar biosynthesis protein FlhG